jgi:hypothetical protein
MSNGGQRGERREERDMLYCIVKTYFCPLSLRGKEFHLGKFFRVISIPQKESRKKNDEEERTSEQKSNSILGFLFFFASTPSQ